MKEFAKGELGPKAPNAKLFRGNMSPVQGTLTGVNRELGKIKDILDESSAIEEVHAEKLSSLLTKVKVEYTKKGVKGPDFYSGLLTSRRSFNRVTEGETPGPDLNVLCSMLSNLEKVTGVTTDLRPEVEKAAAREMPRALQERLDATEAKLGEKIKLEAVLAARVGSLQKKVKSLKRDLAVAGAQRQILLRRLEQAEQALQEALEQWQENSEELRECAARMLKVVSEIKPFLNFSA
ncbi:hypothetical protein [Streptomyces sp. 2A115]|uniref:hypothetical protein n=1 Tax=Streptomyces sp. 2A115 TaxID=3457439 RepID=UPI003FD5BB51